MKIRGKSIPDRACKGLGVTICWEFHKGARRPAGLGHRNEGRVDGGRFREVGRGRSQGPVRQGGLMS